MYHAFGGVSNRELAIGECEFTLRPPQKAEKLGFLHFPNCDTLRRDASQLVATWHSRLTSLVFFK
jgi:hypothetical protein